MRKLLLTVVTFSTFSIISAQKQPFKSGFVLKPNLANNNPNELFTVPEKQQDIEIGFLETSRQKLFSTQTVNDFANKQKKNLANKLRGIVEYRNEDTLFIKLWRFSTDPHAGDNRYVNSADQDKTLYLVIHNWYSSKRRGKFKDIPFRNRQIIAANFPVRVNLENGSVNSGFTNASISYTWVWGHARIYKSEFIDTRYRFFGIGPSFGFGTNEYKVGDDSKEEFSLTSGLSTTFSIYDVQLLFSLGYEFGFNTKKAFPFLGIGIGLDLYEVVNPEIKKKE